MIDNLGKTVLVLTALEVEFNAVRRLLHEPRTDRHPAGTTFVVGGLPGVAGMLVLAITRMGNPAAATVTERAIAHYRPDAILFTGIAGALHSDLNPGDVVVGTKVYSYHGGLDETAGFRARPEAWPADHTLENLAHEAVETSAWHDVPTPPRVVFRPIAAGEVVLNSVTTQLAEQLRTFYNDAAVVEMESAGAARAAQQNRVPFLGIRGVSDRADGQKYITDAQGYQSVAAVNAALLGVEVARTFLRSTADERAESVAVISPRTSQEVEWTVLTRPAEVLWKSDRSGLWQSMERTSLEVHVAPAVPGRLQMRDLDRLGRELPRYGREHGLFDQVEELARSTPGDVLWFESKDYRTGPRGLAVGRTGQRSVWSPLPSDSMGAVLDPDDVIERIMWSLGLLSGMSITAPAEVAIAIGLDSANMLTEGRVQDLPRNRASGMKMLQQLRLPPEDSVPWSALAEAPGDIAEELTARLVAAFHQVR